MSIDRAASGRWHAKVRAGDAWFNVGSYDSDEEARAAVAAEYERIHGGTSALLKSGSERLDRRAYAARIGVPQGTVGRWLSEGLPSLPVGHTVRIDPAVADAWVAVHHPKSVAFGRQSTIYFVQRERDEAVKIGWTSDVVRRVVELRKAGDTAVLLAAIPGDKKVELALHARFAKQRLSDGEWFAVSPELLGFIESLGTVAA